MQSYVGFIALYFCSTYNHFFSDFKGQDLTLELDRLRKEKIDSVFEIEKYKKRISIAIVFAIVGFAVAITMIIWRFRYHP